MKTLFSTGYATGNIDDTLNKLHSFPLPIIPSGGDRVLVEYQIETINGNGTIVVNIYEQNWSSLRTTIATFGGSNSIYIVRINIFNENNSNNIRFYGEIIDANTGLSTVLSGGIGPCNAGYNLVIEGTATNNNSGDIKLLSGHGVYINQI